MTRMIEKSNPPMPAPREGMVIEPVTTYEELPIVTEAARAELLASLERGEEDAKAGRVERMSVAELKADMRADFERITGYKIP
jgi:hypothetical protein